MDDISKLMKARLQLLLRHPFFASLALRLHYQPDPSVGTAVTNGTQILYNPGYFDSLSVEEIAGVIAHEVMHIALLHHLRCGDRHVRRWNHATDYAINPLLLSAGITLPAGAIYEKEYNDMNAEAIYRALSENPQIQEDGDEPGMGDVTVPQEGVATEWQEQEIEIAVVQAAMLARRQGKLPAFADRVVEELLHPRINWKTLMEEFIIAACQDDYSWEQANCRYLHTGIYLPRLQPTGLGEIAVFLDTSGSIENQLLAQAVAEIGAIGRICDTDTLICYIDSEVEGIQIWQPGTELTLQPKGGGGTDFRPGFQYLDDKNIQPAAVIYLTDGECSFFPPEPCFPVLWAVFNNAAFQPPFGQVVHIQ